MNSGLMNEPSFGAKVKVVTSNGQVVHLYNAQGEEQQVTKPNGTVLTIFEAKKLMGKSIIV